MYKQGPSDRMDYAQTRREKWQQATRARETAQGTHKAAGDRNSAQIIAFDRVVEDLDVS